MDKLYGLQGEFSPQLFFLHPYLRRYWSQTQLRPSCKSESWRSSTSMAYRRLGLHGSSQPRAADCSCENVKIPDLSLDQVVNWKQKYATTSRICVQYHPVSLRSLSLFRINPVISFLCTVSQCPLQPSLHELVVQSRHKKLRATVAFKPRRTFGLQVDRGSVSPVWLIPMEFGEEQRSEHDFIWLIPARTKRSSPSYGPCHMVSINWNLPGWTQGVSPHQQTKASGNIYRLNACIMVTPRMESPKKTWPAHTACFFYPSKWVTTYNPNRYPNAKWTNPSSPDYSWGYNML